MNKQAGIRARETELKFKRLFGSNIPKVLELVSDEELTQLIDWYDGMIEFFTGNAFMQMGLINCQSAYVEMAKSRGLR